MIARRTVLAASAGVFSATAAPLAHSRVRAKVGVVLPLTGVQAGVANELLTGYQLAFARAKSEGVDVDLLVQDDYSMPEKTAAAVRGFGLDRSVLATSGIVGTPHAKLAIPEARAAGLPVIGIRSGASELRDGGAWVYHLRASYEAEIDQMLIMLRASVARIGVVYSQDSFGIAAFAYLQSAAKAAAITVAKAVAAERNGSDVARATTAVTSVSNRIEALVVLMIAKPTVAALRAAREQTSFYGPTFAMSFTAGRDLAEAGGAMVGGLGLVSAFNLPRIGVDETSRAFKAGLAAIAKDELINSVTAFEGFAYGLVLSRAIGRAGERPSRESLARALEAQPGLPVCGQAVRFDGQLCGRHFLQVLVFDRAGVLRA